MTRWLRGVGLVCIVLVAGCGDPYASEPRESSPRQSATTTVAPAVMSPTPTAGDVGPSAVAPEPPRVGVDARATRSPAALARAYTLLGINWDWRTIVAQLERAQRLAVGSMEDDLVETTEIARTDESLKRDRAGSRGHVMSLTVKGTGSTRRVVVVTREQRLRDGRGQLERQLTKVYAGKLRLTAAGWRVLDWDLEP